MTAEPGGSPLEEFLADPTSCTLDMANVVSRCAKALGLRHAVIYLADLQQRHLVPLTDVTEPLSIDESLAGWCYRTQSLRVEESERDGMTAWFPLLDGAERLGVLAVHTHTLTAESLRQGRAMAALLAMMTTSKRAYKETFVRRTRTRAMHLPAEMLRAFLPPRTIGNPHIVSTAVLEPAYDLGGDAFDHALTTDTLHAVVLDAMGHNLLSGLTSAVALAACRNARRVDADLLSLVDGVDEALSQWLPDQFCTGILARLDFCSGVLKWVNCGHPAPLLIRDHRLIVDALSREADPPMGLRSLLHARERQVHESRLQPGDRVLLYTDGVTEARTADGRLLGLERFADYVIRASATGEIAPETLRRLIHSLLDSQDSRLRDDATILMFEWQPSGRLPGTGLIG